MPALWIAIAVSVVLSFAGKLAADAWLHGSVAVLGSIAGLQYAQNPGIAFGILFPPLIQALLILSAVGVVLWMALASKRGLLAQIAYGCIVGGALGNIADRLFDGLVTDFFQVGTFPIFNVADSCITIGVGLLLLDVLLSKGRHGDAQSL